MQKLKFGKMTATFMSAAAFFAVFGAANLALCGLTPYRLYLSGFFGRDFVWLAGWGLTLTVVGWICAALARRRLNAVLKAAAVILIAALALLALTVSFAVYAFDNENGDQYRFASPDGSATAMVCEAVEFPDSCRYDVYMVETPFVLRYVGGESFDIGINSPVPHGGYTVDWSGGEPMVTPEK